MSALTRISTDQAIAVLFEDAVSDTALVGNKLAEAARRDPSGIEALLKAAGVQALGDVATAARLHAQKFPLVIGQPVTHQGISFGQMKSGRKTIDLNLIPDYLRDTSGAPVELNGNQAIDAVTALNGGVKYGNGYEKAIGSAVSSGEFKDGTLILARREDLLKIARERRTNLALRQMNEMIASGSKLASWCVSSTENFYNPSYVYHVVLKDGHDHWYYKDINLRSRVAVLRGFNCG
jgi:hypothetical protein